LSTEQKKVTVIGGGIAGLTAAWELSRLNMDVDIVEKNSFLGGHAIQFCCKATDECLQCGACSVEKMLKNVVNAPNINIHLSAEVDTVSKNGKFSVSLKQNTGDADKKKACDAGYDSDPAGCAALRGYSKNNAALEACDTAHQFDADAIVLASGFQPFDATRKSTYGYGTFRNVITGLEMEQNRRVNGSVLRPSDGKPPQKVAFIQCVGSRDERLGNLWCSKVCCPYALRTAETIKHDNPDAEITVFYMDIQNTGKNFPSFYDKCKADMSFVRNIPVDVYPMEDEQLRIRYVQEEDGVPEDAIFDLLVLSIGIMPGADNADLSDLLKIELNQDGFFASADQLNRTLTSENGIFIAGTAQGPKNIPSSMAHAGQAVCEVAKYLKGGK